MDEQKEIKIKNILCSFIRENFVLEGDPIMIDYKVRDLANVLYILFVDLTKE